MGVAVGPGDRAYNTASSAESQQEFLRVATLLEDLLALRNQHVAAAMDRYEATGVSPEYLAKEQRWHTKADAVSDVVKLLKRSLVQNDDHAADALKKAGGAVASML